MNKKGFSRLEFIVVFAILVVITYFAIPIFAKLFANSKKSAFEIEVKDIYRNLLSNYYDSSIVGKDGIIELGSGSCQNKMKYSENDSLRYHIILNNGNVSEYKITNGRYALSYNASVDKNIASVDATELTGRSSPYTFLFGTCAADIKDAKPFEVAFNSNSGIGGQKEVVLATYQEDMPAISNEKPIKGGYTFLGWYDNPDYTKGTQYYNSNCKSAIKYNLETDITLFAGWIKDGDDKKLYTVLEKEASLGSYAKEYVGIHKDTLDESGDYKIHYFYSLSNVTSSIINNNKRNVIVGDTCFQILRTTDSGGIKLIYNGEASIDKKCNNKRTHNGIIAKGAPGELDAGTYAVSDTFDYDLVTGKFKLNGNVSVMSVNSSNLTDGKYSCLSSNKNSTCTKIYFIVSYNNELYKYLYVISEAHYSEVGTSAFNYASTSLGGAGYMTNKHYSSSTKLLSTTGNLVDSSMNNMYLSASITKNNDGTYSLNSSSLINTNGEKWKKDYLLYKGYYFCDGFSDKTCSEDKINYLITPTSSGKQVYIKKFGAVKYAFGSGYTYENGKYTLTGIKEVSDWVENYEKISETKYTCLSSDISCSKLYYVLRSELSSISYLTLTDNKSIDNITSEMLNNNVNKNDSIIKKYIENWYYNNMLKYSSVLEDPVYCSDRDINTNEFKLKSNDTLTCKNDTDKFNTKNNAAKTAYPVSLVTGNESKLFGDSTVMKTGSAYWIDDDYSYDVTVSRAIINKNGDKISAGVRDYYGIRPVISLKKDIKYLSGDGNVDSPYIIKVD